MFHWRRKPETIKPIEYSEVERLTFERLVLRGLYLGVTCITRNNAIRMWRDDVVEYLTLRMMKVSGRQLNPAEKERLGNDDFRWYPPTNT